MPDPSLFQFWQTLNGILIGNAQSSSVVHYNPQHPEYFQRIQRHIELIERDRQQYCAMVLHMEQEKRAILACNSHLTKENKELREEIEQLKRQQKSTKRTREGERQTEKAKEKPNREMNSIEMIEALVGNVQDDHHNLTADGSTNKRQLAIAIPKKKHPNSNLNLTKPPNNSGWSVDDEREFGQKIEQIISNILDNHSPLRKRPKSMPNDAATTVDQPQHNGANCAGEEDATEKDIECIRIVPFCPASSVNAQNGSFCASSSSIDIGPFCPSSSSANAQNGSFCASLSIDVENEFPPPPKTPPPPMTPPLPLDQTLFATEMFETILQTTPTPTPPNEPIASDQQPPHDHSSTTTTPTNDNAKDGHQQQQNDDASGGEAPDERGKEGGGNGDEVIFVDDVCRNKWVPSMAKRERTTEWPEVILEETDEQQREETEEAANIDNAADTSLTVIEHSQRQKRVKEEKNK